MSFGLHNSLGVSGGDGAGGSGPVVPPIAWDFLIYGEDVVYAAGLATTWADSLGGPVTFTSNIVGAEPTTGGKVLNGFSSPLFPTRGALMDFPGTVAAGTFTTGTFFQLWTPDWGNGAGDRMYGFEYSNNTVSADQHIAGGIANIPGFLRTGLAYGSTWTAGTDSNVARTHLIAYVLEADGSLSIYRDGGLLQNVPGNIPTPAHTATYLGIGASYPNVVNPTQAFRGSMHAMGHKWGVAATAAQMAALYSTLNTKYAFGNSEWVAENMLNAGLVIDSRNARANGGGVWFGAADLAQIDGNTNTTTARVLQGTPAFMPSDGPRIQGYSTKSFDGVDDFMAGSPLSPDNISAAFYEIFQPFYLLSVGSAFAPAVALGAPYNLVQCLADSAGFYWNGFNTNAGAIDGYFGHWDGITVAPPPSVYIPGEIFLNTWHLLHVYYDSTLAGGTITARIDANAPHTYVGAAPISNVANPLFWGTGLLAQPTRFHGYMPQAWTFTGLLSASNRANARALITSRFGIAT